MKIEIKKLTPDLAEDYVRFFDETPHNGNSDDQKCYCVTWRSDAAFADVGDAWFATREERRNHAIRFVESGGIQGYLAYCDNKIVGWCNASGDCSYCVSYLRSFWPIEEDRGDVRVKSVFCFMIAPEFQRTGIATKLLERVCQDAAADGFDIVEAYTAKEFDDSSHKGPLAMYEKCGFYKHAEREGKIVMQKKLKG